MEDDIDMPTGGMNEEMMEDFPDDNLTFKVGEEKEIGKQGLKKKLVKEGEGWDNPEVGDEVEGAARVSPSLITFVWNIGWYFCRMSRVFHSFWQ